VTVIAAFPLPFVVRIEKPIEEALECTLSSRVATQSELKTREFEISFGHITSTCSGDLSAFWFSFLVFVAIDSEDPV
jgi:hypothetical protein